MAEKTIVLLRKKHLLILIVLIAAGVVVFVSAPFANREKIQAPVDVIPPPSSDPLSVVGYDDVKVAVSPSIIYLTHNCRQLAMVTTDAQSFSIQNGLAGRIEGRPTAHDVFQDLIQNFGIIAKIVKIDSYKDSTYYATLYVQQGNRLLGLDAKPSDAIAVAVRTNATVYVRSSIMDTGKIVC